MCDLLKSFVYCGQAPTGRCVPGDLSPYLVWIGRNESVCHACSIALNKQQRTVPVAGGLAVWLRYLMGLVLVMLSFSAAALNCATPGQDGAGGTLSGVINRYWPGSSTTSNTITFGSSIGNGLGISTGDLLLVIQMQDAAIDTSNTNAYGGSNGGGSGSTALNSSGLYEFVRATSNVGIGGGTVTFVGGGGAGLLNAYTSTGQRRFQVVRVPQYTTASIGPSALTAAAWNGSAGGVLAFDVAGQLTLLAGATVNVDRLGFRGGAARQLSGGAGSRTDYRTSAGVNNNGSKGEGIAGTPQYVNNASSLLTNAVEGYANGSHGRGAPGNAGGGGTDGNPIANNENTGGGGGSNAGAGGKGGNGWNGGTGGPHATGGFGGFGYIASLNSARLFLGGGGGSGTTNNGTGTPAGGIASSGVAGGGLVMIRAGSITGAGTISANGSNADITTITNDASGGGGAGGSVLVYSNAVSVGSLSIQANGGNGGNNTGGGTGPHGPGGGGGGGFVVISGAASITVNGGAAGTTVDGTNNYGATPGGFGTSSMTLSSASIPGIKSGAECATVIVKTFNPDPITASGTSTLSVTLTSKNNVQITGLVLTDVFPTAPGAMTVAVPLVTTNTCGGTLLDSGGGTLAAADIGIRLNAGGLNANGSCIFTIRVTTSVAGTYTNTIDVGAIASTNGGTNGSPASDTLVVLPLSLVFLKTVSATSDPSNGTTNPKNIPGAEVLYSLRVTNTGPTAVDNNSTVITDPIPANTELFVGDLGAANSGPIAFVQGTPTSALTWTYTSLTNTADDVAFSDIDCITFTYVPVPVSGYDPVVKCIRLNPKGTIASPSGGGNPYFELRFRVRIK